MSKPTPPTSDAVNREARLDDLGAEADDLEDLGAPVGVDGGDAHLRQDLQHAGLERGLELAPGPPTMELAELVVVGHARHGLAARGGAHGVGAVAEQGGDAVRLAGVVRRDDDRRLLARVLGDEPVVHRAEREQRRDRRAVGATLRSEITRTAAPAATASTARSASARMAARARRGRRRRGRWRRAGPPNTEPVGVEQRLDRRGVEEERRQLEQAGGVGLLGEQRAARPEHVRRVITSRSRSGSMGGLVTWAKRCRR